MHERRPEFFIIDILIAIDKIRRNTEGLKFEKFLSKEGAVDLTMRNLEIIGEAANQLLKYPDFLNKTDIEWRKIVNFRNIAIHFYFGIDFDIVFHGIVKKNIPQLEKDLLDFIKQKKDKTYFLYAIEDAKADLEEMHRSESVAYLSKIENKIS
ncbi:DUF86 domain-containing protein [Candidatus Dependentiae bacterium]